MRITYHPYVFSASMVVSIVDQDRVFTFKFEGHTPIAIDFQ